MRDIFKVKEITVNILESKIGKYKSSDHFVNKQHCEEIWCHVKILSNVSDSAMRRHYHINDVNPRQR